MLAGGASRRMGTDKAFVEVGGRALVTVAVAALRDAGATVVVVVGGDLPRLAGLGLRTVADDHPGEGPLGGILTALRGAPADVDVVVVLACDLPGASAAAAAAVVEALAADARVDVAVPAARGQLEALHAAWRRSTALPSLEAAFAAGERSPARAMAALTVAEVHVPDPAALADADEPGDLPGGHRYHLAP